MKTIWGLLMAISVCVLFFFGIQDLSTQALINNENLNNDSIDKISKFSNNIDSLEEYQNLKIDTSISSNSTNGIDEYFKETAENKNTIEKTRDAIEFVYDIPTLILLAIPFVDFTDTSLLIYKNVIWFMLSLLVILVIYKAVRTGEVDE